MQKFIKKRSQKAGLPPGTLVFIGNEKPSKIRITIINYDEKQHTKRELDTVEECFVFKSASGVTWINIDGVHDVGLIEKVNTCFGVHPLVMEDIVNTEQRPKLEDYGEYLFVVLKMLFNDTQKQEIFSEHVCLIIGPNYVISFQEDPGDIFDPIRDRIKNDKGRIRKMGADYLAYALIDTIVDNYFVVLENLGAEVDVIEEELMNEPSMEIFKEIHLFKREMLYMHKSIWPLREVISGLMRTESRLIKKTTIIYLRDVYDHTIQVIDTIETFRDMLSGMLDIYLSSMSNRMNEIMKVLTIISTIFIPLTFIAGIYGMNFDYMPELRSRFGYFGVLGFMAMVGIAMLFYFRKKKWI